MVRMVRVIQPAAVRHPETGDMVVPDPKVPHREDDVFVRAYPWMFSADEDMDPADAPVRIETVSLDGGTQEVRRGRGSGKPDA